MSLRVRAMQESDLDSVYAIEIAAHRAPWGRQIISDCVFVGYDCRVLEVETDSEAVIASYIICRYSEEMCHILNLCVSPLLQGKGYGGCLLQDVIDSPAQQDTVAMVLEVRPSNLTALRLYKKMGFYQLGIKQGYYRDEDSIEDAIVLKKMIHKSNS